MQSKTLPQSKIDMIAQWQRSGLSKIQWCRQQGIAYQTFYTWYAKYRKQHQCNDSSFVRLQVSSSTSAGAYCDVLLPDGKRILFHQPVSCEYLKSLIA